MENTVSQWCVCVCVFIQIFKEIIFYFLNYLQHLQV